MILPTQVLLFISGDTFLVEFSLPSVDFGFIHIAEISSTYLLFLLLLFFSCSPRSNAQVYLTIQKKLSSRTTWTTVRHI